MKDANLKKLRMFFDNSRLEMHCLEELQFYPNVFQRIHFFERPTRAVARKSLGCLWNSIGAKSIGSQPGGSLAVIGYPLDANFREWALHADVTPRVAAIAIESSETLIRQFDNLNRCITAVQDHGHSHVLPNQMLWNQDRFVHMFQFLRTSAEVRIPKRMHG